MTSDRTIDDLDARILGILQDNARTTQADIAKAVGLAPSAVLERIRKLEAKGAIRDYVARIDPTSGESATAGVCLGQDQRIRTGTAVGTSARADS